MEITDILQDIKRKHNNMFDIFQSTLLRYEFILYPEIPFFALTFFIYQQKHNMQDCVYVKYVPCNHISRPLKVSTQHLNQLYYKPKELHLYYYKTNKKGIHNAYLNLRVTKTMLKTIYLT